MQGKEFLIFNPRFYCILVSYLSEDIFSHLYLFSLGGETVPIPQGSPAIWWSQCISPTQPALSNRASCSLSLKWLFSPLQLFTGNSRLKIYSPYNIRVKPPGCWETGSENKTKQSACEPRCNLELYPLSPILPFPCCRKQDWASPASPDLPRLPFFNPRALFFPSKCPPYKNILVISILQREVNVRDFLTKRSSPSADPGFEAQAAWHQSPWPFHCSHQHIW